MGMDYRSDEVRAGDLLMLVQGEYSDKTQAPFRVLKDFKRSEVVGEFRAHYARHKPDDPYGDHDGQPAPDDFLAWLHKQGYIEDMDYIYWHIGSYGEFMP